MVRFPSKVVLAVLAIAAAPARAEQAAGSDVASSLPEDIPGGPDEAARALRSGVPQLVKKALEDVVFAQEPPQFAPWRAALAGRAAGSIRDLWLAYLVEIYDREVACDAFRKEATTWFEEQTELSPEDSALLSCRLAAPSRILAERHLEPARAGNMNALVSLALNPEGNESLLKLCKSDAPESVRAVYAMAATRAQNILFRPLFQEWIKSESPHYLFCGINGLLRLGDPADIPAARDYLKDRRSYRRFETYRSLAKIRSKEVVDLLIAEQPVCPEGNGDSLMETIAQQDDERSLPFLRRFRDDPRFTKGVVIGLWRIGRAGDVPWLCDRMEAGDEEAAKTLRHLLGHACPIEYGKRVEGVRAWIAGHDAEIRKDEALARK